MTFSTTTRQNSSGSATSRKPRTTDGELNVTKRPIDLKAIGERLEFTDARERTNGRRSEGVMTLGPDRRGPEAHAHMQQEEGFEVVSGTLVLTVGGQSVTVRAGESFLIAAGDHHTFRNDDPTVPVVARFWLEPALDTEWMLQTMGEWAMDRGGDWKKMPLLPAAHLLFRLRHQYRLAAMPFWVQDLLFGFLSGVAYITGQTRHVRLPGSDLHS